MLRYVRYMPVILLLLLSSLAALTTHAGAPAQKIETLRVLFIGNSYTGVGSLDALVPAMVNGGPSRFRMESVRSISGGKDLKYHWEAGDALEKIRTGKFDYVILQNNSKTALEEERRINARKYTPLFIEAILKTGATPVIYGTWARKNEPEKQSEINEFLLGFAGKQKALFAPVGPAWVRSLEAKSDLILHCADKSHPDGTGVYLNACVFYAVLTGESPVDVPHRTITMRMRHPDTGKGLPYIIDVTFDEPTARHFQEVAREVVEVYRNKLR